jgi:hypothetical protein
MKQSSRGYRGGLLLMQGGEAGSAQNAMRVPAEHLDYLSDMIRQLQKIARQGGCSTLAGILELAFREVDVKRREQMS